MEQMLQRMQPQPQKQRDSLDGIDKRLGAATINSPARDNIDADGDVNIGEEDQNPPTGDKNSG